MEIRSDVVQGTHIFVIVRMTRFSAGLTARLI